MKTLKNAAKIRRLRVLVFKGPHQFGLFTAGDMRLSEYPMSLRLFKFVGAV